VIGVLGSLWSRIHPPADPYEDFYLNAVPADPRNLVVNRIRSAPEGSVFAVKAETHTPEVMSAHVKELGRFFGADLVHIAGTAGLDVAATETEAEEGRELPFAVFCLFRAEHDPREAPGIGGHAAALEGAFATFQIGAIIREFGFHATRLVQADADKLAAAAGLGTLDESGRLSTPRFGRKVHVADVILTDLPVAPD
jgi:hypothetical protein